MYVTRITTQYEQGIAPVSAAMFAVPLLIPVIIFSSTFFHPITSYIGVPGDSQQTMWFMGWFWHAVLTGHNPFITHMMNYPNGINLMDNTSVIAEGILFGPLQWLISSAFMYNAMMFVNLYVIGAIGTLILREFRVRRWLAMLGGVVMQVLPYTTAQMAGHANLTVTMWTFGALYTGLRVVNGRIHRPSMAGVVMGLLLACQFYTSLEILTTTAMVAVLFFALAFITARHEMCRLLHRVPKVFIISSVVWCILLVLPGLFYFEFGPYRSTTFIPTIFNNRYVTDLSTFIFASPAYVLSPVYLFHNQSVTNFAMHLTGNFTEQDGYIGVFGLVLLSWAVHKQWKVRYVRVLSVMILVICLLSMGTHLHVAGKVTRIQLPWGVIAKIPLIGQVLPARLMFFADVFIVILLFTAFERVLAEGRRVSIRNVLASIVILLLTWMPVIPYPSSTTPSSFSSINLGGTLYNQLRGRPTLIFSDNFYEVMQGLADSGYTFPVANEYGFQADSFAELSYRPLSYAGWPVNQQGRALQDYLASAILSTRVSKVMVIPVSNSLPPQALTQAMTQLCGPPATQPGYNTYIWTVPKQLTGFWFEGEVSDPAAIIDSEFSGKAAWAGKSWIFRTRGETRIVTISAPQGGLPAGGIRIHLTGAVDKSIVLKPGQSTSVVVKSNQTLEVRTDWAMTLRDPNKLQPFIQSVLVKLSTIS